MRKRGWKSPPTHTHRTHHTKNYWDADQQEHWHHSNTFNYANKNFKYVLPCFIYLVTRLSMVAVSSIEKFFPCSVFSISKE